MFSYYCSIASTSFKPISFVDLKLWLVKVVKSDVCEWRVFAEPVAYIIILLKLCFMHIIYGIIVIIPYPF